MKRPVIRCRTPKLLKLFLCLDFIAGQIVPRGETSAEMQEFKDYFEASYGDFEQHVSANPQAQARWEGTSRESRRPTEMVEQFIAHFFPEFAMVPSGIKYQHLTDYGQGYTWHFSVLNTDIPALGELQDVVGCAARDVQSNGVWADIQTAYVPRLRSLQREYIISDVTTSYLLPCQVPDSEFGFCYRSKLDGALQIRVPHALRLSSPFCFLFGYVWTAAIEWLDDLIDRKCLTCGLPIPEDCRVNRRYCLRDACRKQFDRQKKSLKMSA